MNKTKGRRLSYLSRADERDHASGSLDQLIDFAARCAKDETSEKNSKPWHDLAAALRKIRKEHAHAIRL